jgi:RimJ/RimL family protein N-acetyltransferase
MSPDGSAEVNISISAAETHKGHGSNALRLACRYVQRKLKVIRVIAHIKDENEVSIKAFIKAGFINSGPLEFKGHRVIKMLWEQPSE